MSGPQKYSLRPIYLVNFFGTLGLSIVFPFLVFLNLEFGGDALTFGFVIAAYSLFQIPGAAILGRLSDKIGRKKVLIASHVGTTASWGVYIAALLVPAIPIYSVSSEFAAFTITLPLLVLFAARGLDGLTGGNVAVANAYLADVSTKSELTSRLGKNSLFSNLGFVMGPAIGGTLGSVLSGTEADKVLLPAIVTLVISAAAIFVILRLRESPLFSKDATVDKTPAAKPRIADVLAIRKIPPMIGLFFVLIITLGLLFTVLPLHTQVEIGWSALDLAAFFVVLGATLIVVEGWLISRLSRMLEDRTIVLIGLAVLAASYALFAFGQGSYGYFLAAVPFAFGIGLAATAQHAYITKLVPERLQGTLQGVIVTADSVGAVIGFLLGGLLYAVLGAYGVYALITAVALLLIPTSLAVFKSGAKNDD